MRELERLRRRGIRRCSAARCSRASASARSISAWVGRGAFVWPCDPDLGAQASARGSPPVGYHQGQPSHTAAVHGLLTRERAEHLDYRVGDDQSPA